MSVWHSQTIAASYSHPFCMGRVGGCDVGTAFGSVVHHALDMIMRLDLSAYGLALADNEPFIRLAVV